MWIAALALGIWWMWYIKQPRCTVYRAKDKASRRWAY